VIGAVDARARCIDQVRDLGVTTSFEHGAERIDVVAQIRAGIDEGVAHAGLRREMRDVREAPVAQQCQGRGAFGEIERIAVHARGGELPGASALERDVVIRIEAVDAGNVGAITLEA